MRLSFSRPTSTSAERDELFSQFGPVGYAGLQLKANQYRDYIDDPQGFLDQWGSYPGVAPELITMSDLTPAGQTALRKLVSFAAAVGAERVVFVQNLSRQDSDEGEAEEFAHVFSDIGREARDMGVALSLHHHYNQPVMVRDEIEAFFDRVGDDSVGLTIDTAHLVKSREEDVAGIIRDFRAVIDNFHLKDFGDGNWQVLGHGKIDFAPIVSAIHEIGYDGWICADEESGGDLVGGPQECFQYMQTRLLE